jgi:sodium transport system ATP-binding protein
VVRTEAISKTFIDQKRGEVKAVEEVSIEARPGSILGVLGVNGAGKTTLLRMLSTVIQPTSGSAQVCGHDVVREPEKVRASIGFLSNTTALYGRLTATEVLNYFGSLYGLEGGRLRERVAFATEKLQLHEFKDRLCDKLSTGQKQRVSIARAILHDPPVLFFDEPTVGLDVVTAQTIMEFIEEQRDSGRTVVFSTHVMSEAERLCDEIAVIHQGRVCGEGTPAALLEATGEQRLEAAFLKLVGYQPRASA